MPPLSLPVAAAHTDGMGTYQIERRDLQEHPTAVVRSSLPVGDIGPFVGHAVGAVAHVLATQGIAPAGPPFARYHRAGEQRFDVEAGFTTERPAAVAGEVHPSTLPGGPVAVETYVGPYDRMEQAYRDLEEWVVLSGGVPAGDPWEVYFSDPEQEPDPEKWVTEIVMPFTA